MSLFVSVQTRFFIIPINSIRFFHFRDQCVLHNHDSDDVLEWLQEDFARHYEQNKAPYMMAFHTNWFQIKELENGLLKFLDWTLTL